MENISKTFIEVPYFTKKWFELGFNDDDLARLQYRLAKDPKSGVMMQGTGGIRKIRFAIKGKGKSSGARVCYVDFVVFDTIYFISVFSKNEKENLTNEEKNILKTLVKELKDECAKKK